MKKHVSFYFHKFGNARRNEDDMDLSNVIRKPFHKIVEDQDEQGNTVTYLEIKGKGLQRWIGELLSCYWCTGIWCAVGIYFSYVAVPHIAIPIITILAIAGCAGIIESFMK